MSITVATVGRWKTALPRSGERSLATGSTHQSIVDVWWQTQRQAIRMDDANLVRQAQQGQASAYEVLVGRWSARVIGYVRSKVGHVQVAEDLAQDSLLKAFRALDSLADPDRFGSWLLSIAHRSTLDWLKAKARTEVRFTDLMAPSGNGRSTTQGGESRHRGAADRWASDVDRPDDIVARDEQREMLWHTIGELPEAQREVLMIYYYDDVTYKDLAEMLGVSSATINARLTKARATLREKMSAITESQRRT